MGKGKTMKLLTRVVAMVGLIAACGLDSEKWWLCLIIAAVSALWVVGYAYFTGDGWYE